MSEGLHRHLKWRRKLWLCFVHGDACESFTDFLDPIQNIGLRLCHGYLEHHLWGVFVLTKMGFPLPTKNKTYSAFCKQMAANTNSLVYEIISIHDM